MKDDLLKNVEKFNENSVKSLNELFQLNTTVLNDILKRQVELTNLCIEENKKHSELLKNASKPEEILEKQTSLVSEYGNKLIEITNENIALAQQTGEKYKKLFEKNLKG